MLVNAIEMLEKAKEGNYAIPQFNTNNLEWTKYILEECESLKSPVIIGASEGAIKYMGGYNIVKAMVEALIKDLNITVPVSLHLDHGSSFETCEKAIMAGFTSVMIDASQYDLNTNIEMTSKVVNLAKLYNVSVEAEVGHIGGTEDNVSSELAYAKVEDAVKLANDTKIDFIAPALGSVHGIYKGEPKLDFDKMFQIKKITNMPLVLHGGSGIPNEMILKAIKSGICKINFNTELQIAWHESVLEFVNANQNEYDPRKVIKSGEKALKKVVSDKIKLLESNNKA